MNKFILVTAALLLTMAFAGGDAAAAAPFAGFGREDAAASVGVAAVKLRRMDLVGLDVTAVKLRGMDLVGGTRAKAKTHLRVRRATAHHRAAGRRAFAVRGIRGLRGKKHEKGLRQLQGGWTFEDSEYRREDFAKLRGKMPWPVESREVSMHFGYQRYGDGNPIWVNSTGITIEAAAGADVKSACVGEVSAVMEIGDVNAVVVRHGHFYVTYSNLAAVSVAKGDLVQPGQCLGQIGEIGQLEFLISEKSDHMLDPEKWLRRD